MRIGDRLRSLREGKNLSQGDIEKRTGLFRCYVSRVEGGYTVPMLDTLEKFARALEIPIYQLFYDGQNPPAPPPLPRKTIADEKLWGNAGREARLLSQLQRLLGRVNDKDRHLLYFMAQKMARRNRPRPPRVSVDSKSTQQ